MIKSVLENTCYGGGRIRTGMPETHFDSGLDPMSNAAREGARMNR